MGERNVPPDVKGFDMDSLGNKSCQYGVLDSDLKWIKKCDDVRAWGKDVYCLKFDKEERTSSLFVNDSLRHVLENDYFWTAGAVLQFQGNILLLERDVLPVREWKN